jgi:hypothetical protein
MKKTLIAFLVLGVLLFFLGLLMLVQQASVVALFSAILPDVQFLELIGVLFQSVGGLLVVYATAEILTADVVAKSKGNQAVLFSLMQSVERVEKGNAEVAAKLDSMEKAYSNVQFSASDFQTCRYCCARIEKGSVFCPRCGKSQT